MLPRMRKKRSKLKPTQKWTELVHNTRRLKVVVTVFHMFKKLEQRVNMLSTDIKDIRSESNF